MSEWSYLDLVVEQRDEAKEERDAALTRIAELERAAETSRTEHAANMKQANEAVADMGRLIAEHVVTLRLATARIRELEGKREELLGLLLEDQPAEDCSFWDIDGCADGKCWHCRRRAIVARIEKATK